MNDRETPNPFTNCRVVGQVEDPNTYHFTDVQRGHPDYEVTRSMLMAFGSCASKWRAGWTPKDTTSTDWGSLMDCLVLTPELLLNRFAMQPPTYKATKNSTAVKNGEVKEGDPIPWDNRATVCKNWCAENDGKQIVSFKDGMLSSQAVKVLRADSRIDELLKCSKTQVLVRGDYKDKDTGLTIPVKCLIDLVPDKSHSEYGRSLADLKTARSAHPRTWLNSVHTYGYDAQGAMNLWLYEAATGEERNTFYHVIQENTHPWQVARRMLSQEFLEIGRVKILNALRRYCHCLKTNTWPNWDDASPYAGWSIVEPAPYMMAIEEFYSPEEEPELSTADLAGDQLN